MLVVNLPMPEGRTAEYRLKEPRAWNGQRRASSAVSGMSPDDLGNPERLLLELTHANSACISHRIGGQLLRCTSPQGPKPKSGARCRTSELTAQLAGRCSDFCPSRHLAPPRILGR